MRPKIHSLSIEDLRAYIAGFDANTEKTARYPDNCPPEHLDFRRAYCLGWERATLDALGALDSTEETQP